MFVGQVVTYWISVFSAWSKSHDKNLNILRTKWAFKIKSKAFLSFLQGFQWNKQCNFFGRWESHFIKKRLLQRSCFTIIFVKIFKNQLLLKLFHNSFFFLNSFNPANIYLLKVNNRNTRKKEWNMFEVNNKNIRATLLTLFWCFIVNIWTYFTCLFSCRQTYLSDHSSK